MNREVLPTLIQSIKEFSPSFIMHTGDLIHGTADDEGSMTEMREALALMDSFGTPVYYAVGNHDGLPGRPGGAAVTEVLLPALAKRLGRQTMEQSYYQVQMGASLLLVLDFTTYVPGGEQEAFLEACLRQKSSVVEHVFLFGHPPLVPVIRPFFTDFRYASSVLQTLERYAVDAYFCGHTHNQIATLHRVGGRWLPQFKSSTVAMPEEQAVHVTDVRPLLPPADRFEYGWGYLEGSAPSWWMVYVDGPVVRVDWHVLGRGIFGTVTWSGAEKAQFSSVSDLSPKTAGVLPVITDIRSMRLRVTGVQVSGESAGAGMYEVYLNGNFIGCLPRLGAFTCREWIEVEPHYWRTIGSDNELRITTGEESMCMGGFVLEVETESGWVRSGVSSFFANTTQWNYWRVEPLQIIQPGEDIQVQLMFA
jgi:hypothetical protein